jgi:hypothetical protein
MPAVIANDNTPTLPYDIYVSGADAGTHSHLFRIDGHTYFEVQATGDGAGGVTTPKIGFFGVAAAVRQAYPGAALKADYAAGDLDTEAEVIIALNATNALANLLRSAVINLGITLAA